MLELKRPKLAQVVIHVEISPAHPLCVGHGAKHGVRLPFEVSRLTGKAIQQAMQLLEIAVERNRRSTNALLVDFGARFQAAWPRQGNV